MAWYNWGDDDDSASGQCTLLTTPAIADLSDDSLLKDWYKDHGCDLEVALKEMASALDQYNVKAGDYLKYLEDNAWLNGDPKMGGDLFQSTQ